jgi:hypothetical protein
VHDRSLVHRDQEWRITRDEYEARELKERQAEIALRIEEHQQGEEGFRATLETLLRPRWRRLRPRPARHPQ